MSGRVYNVVDSQEAATDHNMTNLYEETHAKQCEHGNSGYILVHEMKQCGIYSKKFTVNFIYIIYINRQNDPRGEHYMQ